MSKNFDSPMEKEFCHVPYSEYDVCWCQPFDGPKHPQCPMHGQPNMSEVGSMETGKADDKNPILLQQKRLDDLKEHFRWKAENNIRFYEKLGMTTEEKVEFLAGEFATTYWLGEMRRLDWPKENARG